MHEVTVIIPAIRWDSLTQQCVSTCLSLFPQSKVILLLDDAHGASASSANLRVIEHRGTIAAKRNEGVDRTTTTFIAFIDSDAYPHTDWLREAISVLYQDESVGIVGGPNVSPPNQESERNLVGMATRSWLVSGKWNFYKDIRSSPRYCDNLPSCNMVMRKSLYEALGGMNEQLELGEDTDLCARVIASGRKIFFTPKAIVYHFDRKVMSYFKQRIIRGAGLFVLISGGSAQRRRPYTYLMLQPVLTLVLVATLPFVLVFSPLDIVLLLLALAYGGLIIMEAMRWSDRPSNVPRLALLVLAGNLLPGVGFMMKAVRLMPPLQRFYRNDNE